MIRREDIFEKWLTANTPVFCASQLRCMWGLILRGRVAVLSADGAEVRSEDGTAVVRLKFSGAEFEYREPKDASPDVRASLPEEFWESATLMVALPTARDGERDLLFFLEVPDDDEVDKA